MSEVLKGPIQPCPFCGCSKLLFCEPRDVGFNGGFDKFDVVVCGACGATGPGFGVLSDMGEKAAIKYWNYRAPIKEVECANNSG